MSAENATSDSSPWDEYPRWTLVLALVAAIAGYVWLRDSPGDHRTWRIVVCSLGAILLAIRGFVAGPRRLGLSLALVAWAGLVIGAMAGRPAERLVTKQAVSEWSFFHYYLGAKYFKEMGYHGLYTQAVLADSEEEEYFYKAGVRFIRNLDTYEFEEPAPETRDRLPGWTEERWEEFRADLKPFYRPLRKRWEDVLCDRGYNATPTWNTSGWLLAQIPASKVGFAVISAIDVLLLAAAFALLVWAVGPLWGLMAIAYLLVFYGNQSHVIGRPFLHDYAAAMAVFVAMTIKRKPGWAAVALAYGAMVRIFPGFLLFGLVVWTFLRWRRTGAIPRYTMRFAPVFVLSCALFAGYGLLNGRGVGAWTEFLGNISTHSEDHRFGGRRIGLQHFFTHKMSNPLSKRGDRRQNWEDQQNLWRAGALLMSLLWLGAMLKSAGDDEEPLDAMLLSMAVVFAVIVLSRYYWGVAGLFFVMGARGRDGPWKGVVGALLLLMIPVFYLTKSTYPSDTFPWFVVANGLWIGWFVFVLVGRMVRRVPSGA
ncbi:MAG: hypothetical protein KDA24_06090 [Deltaproteobacteria bacterium]|nr:hypothetical protein [Deltaproteobacteria bacterium]